MSNEKKDNSDAEWYAKLSLYANTVYMLGTCKSLLQPSLASSVGFGIVGSELAPVVLVWQVLAMRSIYLNHPHVLFGSWLGRLCATVQTASLSLLVRNLLQGVFVAPVEFSQALQSVGVPPVRSADWSLQSVMWRVLALVPLFAVSQQARTVHVQRNIRYAQLDDNLLQRWKRTPSLLRNANMLAFRGRISNWLSLDVHRCTATTKEMKPVLMYIHGGGWVAGDKFAGGLALLKAVAARGDIVVVAVNYRLVPNVLLADQVKDCKRALLFVKQHCHEWGGDADKVFVAGESAGGHLSALLGCTANLPEFQPEEGGDTSMAGCLPIYGVFDMSDSDGHLSEIKERHFGVPIGVRPLVSLTAIQQVYSDETRHLYDAVSPTFHVRQLQQQQNEQQPAPPRHFPPYFITHGTLDSLASYTDAKKFHFELSKLHDKFPQAVPPAAFASIEGGVHGYGYLPSPRANALGDAFCDFIWHHAGEIDKSKA